MADTDTIIDEKITPPNLNVDQSFQAYRQTSSYQTRHSTIASELFFHNWPLNEDDGENDIEEAWRSLPQRIETLTLHFLQSPESSHSELRSINLSKDGMEARRIALTASVMCSAPTNFWECWRRLFWEVLRVRVEKWEQGELEESMDHGYENDVGPTNGNSLDFDDVRLYQNLHTLKWLPRTLSRPLSQALHDIISTVTKSKLSGDYEDETLLDSLNDWKNSVIVPFLLDVFGRECYDSEEWDSKLEYTVSECYCRVRMGEIFDILAEYPDSLVAVQELAVVLQRTRMQNQIGQALRQAFQKRLLHPGAQTSQILQVYINTIKVMRVIDPSSDGLLDSVTSGVRAYLRGRGDTVRCIITSLTDEEAGGDLYEELQRHDARPLEHAQYDSDDDEDPPDFNWQPTPSLYCQRTSGGSSALEIPNNKNSGDILSMLVGIYGSKDLFVDEYRVMLADKLLANTSFETDKEVHNLELLKLRFGETSMRQCEIMIKDMDDSKRIISNIHSTLRSKSAEKNRDDFKDPVVDAAIVSHIFWPALQKEPLKNHPRIQSQLDQFSIEYAKLKNPRRLVWFYQLGEVQLELEVIEDGEMQLREFHCSPLQATLISHFEDKDQWSAIDLSNESGVPEDLIRKKMGFWINNRVIKIVPGSDIGSGNVYELVSLHDISLNSGRESAVEVMYEDEEGEGMAVSLGGQEAEEMQTYESYIVGMLSNLGQLPLERIHNMLKMFVTGSEHRYNKTPQQLSLFLQKLCKDDKLEFGADGMYKLIKK